MKSLIFKSFVAVFLFAEGAYSHIPYPGTDRPNYRGQIGIGISADQDGLENIHLDCGHFTVEGFERTLSYNVNHKQTDLVFKFKGASSAFFEAKDTYTTLVAARHGQHVWGVAISQYDYLNNFNMRMKAVYSGASDIFFKVQINRAKETQTNMNKGLYDCTQTGSMTSVRVPYAQFAAKIEHTQHIYDQAYLYPVSPNPWEDNPF